jgi:hypothetical protein
LQLLRRGRQSCTVAALGLSHHRAPIIFEVS